MDVIFPLIPCKMRHFSEKFKIAEKGLFNGAETFFCTFFFLKILLFWDVSNSNNGPICSKIFEISESTCSRLINLTMVCEMTANMTWQKMAKSRGSFKICCYWLLFLVVSLTKKLRLHALKWLWKDQHEPSWKYAQKESTKLPFSNRLRNN